MLVEATVSSDKARTQSCMADARVGQDFEADFRCPSMPFRTVSQS
jgi:hypothetical protein